MKLKAAFLSALVVLTASAGAVAGPVADAGQRAEALATEGKALEALQALDEAVEAVWVQSPLLFRNVVLADSSDDTAARERPDRVFQPDDKLRVRVEPVGYGYGAAGAGNTIGFDADLAIENATGQVLVEAKDVFSISAEAARRKREFDMVLSFTVPYVRPGDYTARFTVRDQNSDKSGTFDVPFTIAAPAAGAAPAQ